MDNLVEKLDGAEKIELPLLSDERGFFKEVIRVSEVEKLTGKAFNPKQMNHSKSSKNTLRGIHRAPWSKLIYVTKGKVQSVLVDLREDSPTFGKYQSVVLGDDNRVALFVPAFVGNSYLVLSEEADYIYLTDQEWSANKETGILWNDEELGIKWMLEEEPMLSQKDRTNPRLSEIFPKK